MKYPSEIHEDTERKILRECAYTRNKHIEIEERYEKLVSRKPSKIDLSALESVLRKKGAAEETAPMAVGSHGSPSEEPGDEHVEEMDLEEHKDEPAEKEFSEETKEVTFEEILKLQTSMMARMEEQSRSDFYESFFDGEKSTDKEPYPEYNEPVITKNTANLVSEELLEGLEEPEVLSSADNSSEDEEKTEDVEIKAVEVDEIILPEDLDGIGMVFATPLENPEAKETVSPEGSGLKKSVGAMLLAAAVLVGGVLLVCSIWPL